MSKSKSSKSEIHLSYCAGKDWQGDGSKESSSCPFGHSQQINAERYVCCHCVLGLKPGNIIADSKGIHMENVNKQVEVQAVTVQEVIVPVKAEVKVKVNKTPKTDENGVTKRRGRPKGSKNTPKSVE